MIAGSGTTRPISPTALLRLATGDGGEGLTLEGPTLRGVRTGLTAALGAGVNATHPTPCQGLCSPRWPLNRRHQPMPSSEAYGHRHRRGMQCRTDRIGVPFVRNEGRKGPGWSLVTTLAEHIEKYTRLGRRVKATACKRLRMPREKLATRACDEDVIGRQIPGSPQVGVACVA